MDLPFLSGFAERFSSNVTSFNPYSNGSSFFISYYVISNFRTGISFNPYSNGSSFFIMGTDIVTLECIFIVSILILMDLPFLSAFFGAYAYEIIQFQSLF